MSEEFDAYYKWLAIPPKDQPPNHYRLLALEIFESDEDVIASAADQRMAHVKAFQTGDHSDASQQLLNELSAARACLLKSDTKQDYDAALRRELGIAEPVDDEEEESDAAGAFPVLGDDAKKSDSNAAISLVMIQTGDTNGGPTGGTSTAEKPAAKKALPRDAKREFKIKLIGHIVAPILGLSLGALILLWIRPDVFGGKKKKTSPPPPRVTIKDNDDKPPPRKIVKPPPKKIVKPPPPPDLPDLPDVTTTGSDIQLPPPPPKRVTPPPPPKLTPEQQIKKAEEKRDKALADGKIDEALAAAKQIAELRKQDVLPIQIEMLSTFGGSASSPEQVRAFANSSFKIIDKAIEDGEKDLVEKLASDVLRAILKIRDTDLQAQAVKRILAIQEDAKDKAVEKSAGKPRADDPFGPAKSPDDPFGPPDPFK